MKKYISMMAMALGLTWGLTACDVETDEEPGGTAIQNLCGYWDVTVDAADAQGNVYVDADGDAWYDPFGVGTVTVYTFNTASNSTAKMWIDDQGTFWDYKFLVDLDNAAGTFNATDVPYNDDMRELAAAKAAGTPVLDDDGNEIVAGTATVTNAKIMLGAAKNLHGMPTDSISFFISFSDDGYAVKYGYAGYRVTGIRHSGFTE